MKQKFTYYLHQDHDYDGMREFLTDEAGLDLSPKAIDKICKSRPFYEVGIICEVDEDGNVEIIGVEK